MVFVMFDHPDAVLDDEQEVDSCQRSQTLPHAVELCEQIHVVSLVPVLAVTVVMASLRLKTEKYTNSKHCDRRRDPRALGLCPTSQNVARSVVIKHMSLRQKDHSVLREAADGGGHRHSACPLPALPGR